MSLTFSSTPTVRSFGNIAERVANAALRPRGPDRKVRAGCVDENDPKAKPWDRNRFSSVKERIATTEALVKVAEQLHAETIAKFPRGRVKQLKRQRALLWLELDELMRADASVRPVGRPATIRIQLDKIDALLQEHAMAITRSDVVIYGSIFDFLCFNNTGRWFPSWERVATAARCCVRTVGRAMKRFEHHGLLAWVSRSRVEQGAPGEAAQRGQTSHAYFLDLRKKMAERLYHRFVQLRDKRLKRMTVQSNSPPPPPAAPPPGNRHVSEQRQAISDLGRSLSLRDGHLGRV
ncbi:MULTISPECIES: hypothetical protein [unclassified Sphingomonas]|uniref:hypothetical protein n=1 Tax=unclassified Sphingomonas TaxID=196159 RepID=UPI00226A2A69|nr:MULTISPECIES: hypothetical protein [unclassified Sphingomonas]